jgi:GT2 family glycosyltransferase
MISIIICSRSAVLNQELAHNIKQTIGVEHEVILIDNSANQYGICEAYNLGVKHSKYPILCFMHDDISYHTQNWGQSVIAHFRDEQVVAIGVAGTPYCAFMPGPWWGNGIQYQHLLQADKNNPAALKSNADGIAKRQAIILDGVWLCIKKQAFDQISFDAFTFKGFHFYDADICMQLQQSGGKVYCINDVLISHASLGEVNTTWIENALTFHRKWEKHLPATCLNLSNTQMGHLEYKTLNSFIWACAANKYTNKQIYALALKYLARFKKGYLFYKTPGYFIKFGFKYLFKKGAPFYNFN